MKSLFKPLVLLFCLIPLTALSSPPYPEYNTMPRPQTRDIGWNPSVMPGPPRYDHERAAPDCQIPSGTYRYVLVQGKDFFTDQKIKKAVLKVHVNDGGIAIATLEIQPDRGALTLQRLLGDEPRREMYIINSYRNVADLRRCSGYGLQLDVDQIRLYDKTLGGSINGYYEPGHGMVHVNGSFIRRRMARGFIGATEIKFQLNGVKLKRTGG